MTQKEILKEKGEVILVVDDYPYNLTTLESILSEERYKNILMASSGKEALSIVNNRAVDLVLLDVMMPDMDGFEVCRALQDNEETLDIPVIMLTAKISPKDLKMGFDVGAVDYIGKPFDRLELIARIKSALKQKQLRDELKLNQNSQIDGKLRIKFNDVNELLIKRTSELEWVNKQLQLEIEGHKRVGEVLRKNEERLSLSQKMSRMISWDWNIVDDIGQWSGDVSSILGRCAKDIVSLEDFLNSIHPEDRPHVGEMVKKSVDTGCDYEAEFRFIWPDGTKHWLLGQGNTLRDANGKATNLVGQVMDITEHKQAEEALQEERGRAEKYLDIAEVMFVAINQNEGVALVNNKGCQVLGYGQEEIIGKNWFDNFIPERIRDEVKSVFQKLVCGDIEPVEYFENTVLTKNGEERIIAWHNSILRNDVGEISGTLSSGVDITDLKHADAALCESEKKYSTLVELSKDGIMMMQDGKVIFSNHKIHEMFGYDESEFKELKFTDFVSENQRELLRKRYIDRMAGKEVPSTYKLQIKKESGETSWIEINGNLVEYNDKPSDLLFIRDISERERAEAELKRSEEKFHTFFETSPDAVILVDHKGVFEDVNKVFCQKTGYTKEEVIGVPFNKLPFIPDKFQKEMLKNLALRISGKDIPPYSIEIITKEGKIIFAEINAKSIYKDGKIIGEAVIARDVTDRKHSEEQIKKKNEELQAMDEKLQKLNKGLEQKVKERTDEVEELLKSKEEFISQLGHDIKTPLTPLTSLLPIIEKKESDPKSKELIEICIRNVGYIKNLVTDTLRLARLNSTNTILDIKEINLSYLVDSILCDNQTIFEGKDIEIENRIGEETIVLADDLRLREVFNNLITNGIKFMKVGGKLTLDAKENDDEDNNRFTTISVRDTGIGLDEEVKTHLFDEFYKADRSSHEFASTGLGLVICKRIVEKHGGKIWVESQGEGNGTTFYFSIPKKEKIEHLAVLTA